MKGILFTEILFNKTVAKEKTMTRRAPASLKVINENPDAYRLVGYNDYGSAIFDCDDEDFSILVVPTYKVGEVVYIKEPTLSGVLNEDGDTFLVYKYDFTEEERKDYKWGNKMFMGADKARYYIRITSVKVERLYDISDEDCLKEGVESANATPNLWFPRFYNYDLPKNGTFKSDQETMESWFETPNGKRYDDYFDNAQESFFSLFRFANRVPKSKEIPNLWVFCYSYCLCDKEGNEL